MIALPVCILVLGALSVQRLACSDELAPTVEIAGPTMGTTYSVKIAAGPLSEEAEAEASKAVSRELDRVNALMSTYRPDSELSRFNAIRSTQPFRVSADTLEVMRIAKAVSESSGGAFDVTVGPLATAWGFGATDRPLAPPSEEELSAIRNRVGYRQIEIRGEASALVKTHPDVEADLSAIAKGYAVDRVARALEELGYEDFLVEVGGELSARGQRPGGGPWRVGIEQPDSLSRSPHAVVALQFMALATSGDYRNYYEVDGQRISHTFDPRVGRPISHNLASVSVLHPQAVWADAYATMLNVLGPEEGLAWAEKHQLMAFFLVREAEGKFREMSSSAFRSYQSQHELD